MDDNERMDFIQKSSTSVKYSCNFCEFCRFALDNCITKMALGVQCKQQDVCYDNMVYCYSLIGKKEALSKSITYTVLQVNLQLECQFYIPVKHSVTDTFQFLLIYKRVEKTMSLQHILASKNYTTPLMSFIECGYQVQAYTVCMTQN